MHATIWKFERKNSQENHHMVWNGATNRPVEKGLLNWLWNLVNYVFAGAQVTYTARANRNSIYDLYIN